MESSIDRQAYGRSWKCKAEFTKFNLGAFCDITVNNTWFKNETSGQMFNLTGSQDTRRNPALSQGSQGVKSSWWVMIFLHPLCTVLSCWDSSDNITALRTSAVDSQSHFPPQLSELLKIPGRSPCGVTPLHCLPVAVGLKIQLCTQAQEAFHAPTLTQMAPPDFKLSGDP